MNLRINIWLSIILLFTFAFTQGQDKHIRVFSDELDSIRTSLKIPGLACAIMKADSIIFQKGFGFADLKNQVRVSPGTTFRVASITKTFASTVLLQLVELGKLNLDSPVVAYGIDFGNPGITVKHLLTHTSEGEPGSFYQYNGFRFSFLEKVIEQTTGLPFYRLLMENIIQPLGMSSSAPGISLFNYFEYRQQKKELMPFFEQGFTHLAKAYELDINGNIVETNYLDEFGTSGGLATNVLDLMKYSAAIDRNQFVSRQTQQTIFSPNKTNDGKLTPYGLGWFTQNYKGKDFFWHYGQTKGESGLFIKVPSMRLTFAVLTNSIHLSSPFQLGDGDLLMSPVAQLFYEYFIDEKNALSQIDFRQPIAEIEKELLTPFRNGYRDFYNRVIISQAIMHNLKSDSAGAIELYKLYARLNFKNFPAHHAGSIVAQINNVGVKQEISKPFVLKNTTKLKIVGVGENCSYDFKSWCDYGWIEDTKGNIIWQMPGQRAKSAGGATKNQKVESLVTLPAGTYKLRFKSDWAHAFNAWDALPPDDFTWGITLVGN